MTAGLLPEDIEALARRVVEENAQAGRTVALAESCTGGLVAAALTEVPGSS
ncbi:MAG: CinA family protein, partial [Pseudomonadota bacterium]|nr:CinA family protein [Pseudomonadota bacterium]